MSDQVLPTPPIPADVDLRDFGFMPLDVVRLRDSDLATLSTGDEFKAAVLLWCAAWHQVPAGSIPNDERWWIRQSGALKSWKKIKQEALRGWYLCTDNRLYHPVVVEKAIEAWQKRTTASRKGKAGAQKRWCVEQPTGSSTGNGAGNAPAIAQALVQPMHKHMPGDSKGQGQGQGQGQRKEHGGAPKRTPPAVSEFGFETINGQPWFLPVHLLDEFNKTYPKIDVATELRKASTWLKTNPERRKTARGMPKYLNRWLDRASIAGPAALPTGVKPSCDTCGGTKLKPGTSERCPACSPAKG